MASVLGPGGTNPMERTDLNRIHDPSVVDEVLKKGLGARRKVQQIVIPGVRKKALTAPSFNGDRARR